ncbi:MAG: GAF domain-containing protein [Anaerolineae bacterium]|nr:GAF domain-containing protein [Anaerolineae bacterium]
MSRRTSLLTLLIVATLVALLVMLPGVRSDYVGIALLCGVLTATAKYFGVLLSQGEISTAYMVGILGILLLPAEAVPALAWFIFAGGLIGSLVRASRPRRRPRSHRTARVSRNVVTVSARVTLSFLAAAWVYHLLGGRQPLEGFTPADVGPVLALLAVYLAVYFVIFLLAVYIDQRPVWNAVSENRLMLTLVLVAPTPLLMLSATFYGRGSDLAYALLLGILVPLSLGLFWFSRLRYNLLRQMQEMRALANISRAVRANQNMDAVLNVVYTELVALLHIDSFSAVLSDSEGRWLHDVLVVRGGQRVTRNGSYERQSNSLIDHVLRSQVPLLLARDAPLAAHQLGLSAPEYPASSWLAVPLLAAGRVLGVLEIASTDPRQRFGTEEQHVLNIIASATSAAIDNAQLYKQQAERAVRLGNLNKVLALLTETLLPDDVLDTVISSASVVSEATAVAVYRYANSAYTLVRAAGLSDSFAVQPILVMRPHVGLDDADQPIVVEDVRRDDRVEALQAALRQEGKAAWIELPLVVGGKGIGAIILYFDRPQHLTSEAIELLRTFANQVAQAIRNADLYAGTYRALEVRIEQLSALAALGRQLMVTTDLQTISQRMLDTAIEATGTRVGAALLRSDVEGQLLLTAHQGYPAGVFDRQGLLEEGITGRALREGAAVCCNRVEESPDYLPLISTTRAQLTVPILWQGMVLGALTLESEQPFLAEHSDFVTQLVNQTVFAVENARLFHDAAEARDRMQAILDTMTEALILIDRHGQVALANPRVDLLGLDNRHLIDQPLDALLNGSTRMAERCGFSSDEDLLRLVQSLRGPSILPESGVYTLQIDSTLRYIQRQVIPVRDEQTDIIGALLVFNDRTEQHNLERAREEFSQMIIHDLRSPLTAVTSSVALLSEIIPPDNEFSSLVVRTADSSQRAIRKLLKRVDSLLDISRIKSGVMSLHLEQAELGPLVDNVCAELEPLAHDLEVAILTRMPDNQPRLVIDVEKVERILLNLVDNALKFSPNDSEIVIVMQVADGLAYVRVIDRGPGVPESERQSIFDRFVQIQNQAGRHRSGSGLGLNFCKLAVEAHGGRIWIEDNPNGGSIFVFTLPIATEGHSVHSE